MTANEKSSATRRSNGPEPSQRIVVGFDVLAEQTDSLTEALAFATLVPKTHVEVVWVPPMAYMAGGSEPDITPLETLNRRVTSVIKEFGIKKLGDADVRVSTIIGSGRPPQAISRIAFMHEANMIIIGSHDKRNAVDSFLLGSVSKKLVGVAPCPVLVMRPRATEALPEVEEPAAEGQGERHVSPPHHYHGSTRNVEAKENMPLLFPMG